MINHKELYSLFENFTSCVVVHDSTSKVIYSNPATLDFFGLTLNEVIGKKAEEPEWKLIREDGTPLPASENPFNIVKDTGKKFKDLIIGITKPNHSSPKWAIFNGYPEFDKNGILTQVIINFTDLTERKRIEEKLNASLDFTKSMIESMQDGFVVLDEKATHIDVNPAMCKMIDFTMEDLSGVSIPFPYWPPEEYENIQNAFQETLAGKPKSYELIFMRKSGERFPVITSPSVLKDKAGNIVGFTANVKDITEKNRSKDELQLALKAAKEAAIIKSRFLDIAAHELRTPTTAFSLLLQLTQKKLSKNIPVDISTLERLQVQVDRISKLVVELLDVSRLERGVMTLKRTPTNIVSLIVQCCEEFNLRDPDRIIRLIEPGPEIIIDCDPLRIFQVLSNLIDNAIKYTPLDSPIEISVSQKSNGGVLVTVKDFGPGISMENQKTLFTLFARGTSKETEQTLGLGLGLFISREIIALHGGVLGVTSDNGQGSSFYFELT